MTKYAIDTCAVIVEFNASVWTARKLDRSTTDEVVTTKNAVAKDAARVNKSLLAGRTELSVIQSHVGAVRVYVHGTTLPWSDTGQRLLPTAKFMEFDARMKTEEDRFWDLVKSFIRVYPTLITAQALALGDMFNRDEFPSAESMQHRFAFNVGYLPVPSAGHFIVDVGNEAQKDLQEKLTRLADQRIEAAVQGVKERLREHLVRMADRLQVDMVKGEVVPRVFHASLVDGAFELCEIVKALNITQDRDLEKARKFLEATLRGVDAKELRENMAVREDVKKNVDTILSKFSW
jgi:hypothetical protein